GIIKILGGLIFLPQSVVRVQLNQDTKGIKRTRAK
ncbi:hypothetical protein SMU75_09529, partial [Streptococcus mutans N3209]